jgi:Na+/proline symporter
MMWAGLGLAVVLGLWWLSTKAAGALGSAAGAVGSAINPVNPGNIFYSGASAASGAISGSTNSSLGSDVYDYLHPNQPSVAAPTPLPLGVIDYSGTYSNEPVITSGSLRDLIH